MSDEKFKAAVHNTILNGNKIDDLKNRLQSIENNQIKLQQNMIWLGNKIDTVIELLQEKSGK